MDSSFEFLKKPCIKGNNLNYIMSQKKVYVNLFEIKLRKEINLFQYPFTVSTPIESGDIRIRNRLFKSCFKKLNTIFGVCFISGDCLYSMRNIDEPKSFNCSLYSKTRKEYLIKVNRWTNQRLIKQNNGPID